MSQKNNEIYKIYQLMEFFTNKFSFNNIMVKNFLAKNEFWLSNPKNDAFNVIRISLSSLDETYRDSQRINNYLDAVKMVLKKDIKFIDVHISNESVYENEAFNTVCVNSNYYSGIEIDFAFPGIKNVIHEVDNPEAEIASRISSINSNIKTQFKQRREVFKQKYHFNATLVIQALCIINFIAYLFLSRKFDSSTASILLGADFKFFTINIGQYWRLLTYAFCHGSLLHIFVNMYTLYIIGNHYENKYGTIKYLFIIVSAIVVAGLTQDVLSGVNNTLVMGMSGGIYALFVIYIIEALENGAYTNRGFMTMIFVNIMLNFMSNVAWQAHLGGAIVGLIYYYAFKEEKVDYKICLLVLLIIIGLVYKLSTIPKLNEYYLGTVYSVIDAYQELGLNGIGEKLLNNVIRFVSK